MDITFIPRRVACAMFVYMSLAVLAVRSECPADAVEQAQRCTQHLIGLKRPPSGGPSAFIAEGSADKAIHACANGDLLNSVNCMERVMKKCEHDNSDPAHFLRGMVDIEKARKSVKYFCTNVRVYAKNADCISRHHNETSKCAEEAFKNFITLSDATSNMDAQMRYQCIFYWTAGKCSEKVVTENCGSAAGDVVGTVVKGFEPPHCASMTYGFSSGRTGDKDGEEESRFNGDSDKDGDSEMHSGGTGPGDNGNGSTSARFNRTTLFFSGCLSLILAKLLLLW